MQIECILNRPGGTIVEVDASTYHFKPSPEHGGAHVAEVENADHIGRLLAIPEAYRVLGATAPAPSPTPVAPSARTVDLMDLPDAPQTTGDEPTMGDNPLPPPADDEGDEGDEGDDTPPADHTLTEAAIDEMDRETLAAEIERIEGRAPRSNAKIETLRQALKTLVADA